MFKIGQDYLLVQLEETGEDGDLVANTENAWKCTEVSMPIVKFQRSGEEMILNVSNPRFVRAFPE